MKQKTTCLERYPPFIDLLILMVIFLVLVSFSFCKDIGDTSKHYLYSDVYRFRQLIREYVYGSNTPLLVTKKQEYKEVLENYSSFLFFDTNEMLDYVYDHPATMACMLLFTFQPVSMV